jgi:hypothetical protein
MRAHLEICESMAHRSRIIETMGEILDYAVPEVGAWLHASLHSPPTREVASRPDFWSAGKYSREELTRYIRLAGGVKRDYALEARTLRSGEILLVNGCHRWAVADELGIQSVPVMMEFEPEPEDEAWPTWG